MGRSVGAVHTLPHRAWLDFAPAYPLWPNEEKYAIASGMVMILYVDTAVVLGGEFSRAKATALSYSHALEF